MIKIFLDAQAERFTRRDRALRGTAAPCLEAPSGATALQQLADLKGGSVGAEADDRLRRRKNVAQKALQRAFGIEGNSRTAVPDGEKQLKEAAPGLSAAKIR